MPRKTKKDVDAAVCVDIDAQIEAGAFGSPEFIEIHVGEGIEPIRARRRTLPIVPAGHPKFVWTSGADVQATWRRYGWTPPSERMNPPPVIDKTPEWAKKEMRRVK